MDNHHIERILFIKPKHIGDALLLTPTISATKLRYPHARIWVLVRQGTESILDGCTEIDQIVTTAPPAVSFKQRLRFGTELALIWKLRSQRFDLAIDLSDSSRGRWLALLSGARRLAADGSARPLNMFWRYFFHELRQSVPVRKNQHRVIKDARVAGLVLDLPETLPALRFDENRMRSWPGFDPTRAYVVMHPGTRWKRKRWPVAQWVLLAQHLARAGFHIVVSSGPDARDVAEAAEICVQTGVGATSTAGKTSWAQLAWIIHGAELFIGVDTAAMHLAAACQTPTVAVFGPSNVTYWGPWQVARRIVTPSDTASVRPELLTQEVRLEDVVAACDELLACADCRALD